MLMLVASAAALLSREQVQVLIASPYNAPLKPSPPWRKVCREMAELGMLDEHQGEYRCSEIGMRVAQQYARLGWFGAEIKKRWTVVGQHKLPTKFFS